MTKEDFKEFLETLDNDEKKYVKEYLESCNYNINIDDLNKEIKKAEQLKNENTIIEQAIKLDINSTYGAQIMSYFRFADEWQTLGASTTLTGRILSKFGLIESIERFFNPKRESRFEFPLLDNIGVAADDVSFYKNPKTQKLRYASISDTDSCYFRMYGAYDINKAAEIGYKVLNEIDNVKVPFYINTFFNGDADALKSDFETITSSSLSYGKKKQYAFIKAWDDGVVLPKEKLKITGLSIKRSDSPKALSNKMKPLFIDIMKGLKGKELVRIMSEITSEYKKLSIYDLSAKRTANNYDKYEDAFYYEIEYGDRPFDASKIIEEAKKIDPYISKIDKQLILDFKKTGQGSYKIIRGEIVKDDYGDIKVKAKTKMVIPFHIKAAILYNELLKMNKLENRYARINSGDKIKLFYLERPIQLKFIINNTSNIAEFDCIAFPSDIHNLPEFVLDKKPDLDKMLQTYFYKKLEMVFDTIEFDPNKLVSPTSILF